MKRLGKILLKQKEKRKAMSIRLNHVSCLLCFSLLYMLYLLVSHYHL